MAPAVMSTTGPAMSTTGMKEISKMPVVMKTTCSMDSVRMYLRA